MSNKPWDPSIRGIKSLTLSIPNAKNLNLTTKADVAINVNGIPLEEWGTKVVSQQNYTLFERKTESNSNQANSTKAGSNSNSSNQNYCGFKKGFLG